MNATDRPYSKSRLERSLGRLRSLSQLPDEETSGEKTSRFHELEKQYHLAISNCAGLQNHSLQGRISRFEPLAMNPSLDEVSRETLRSELDLLISALISLSAEDIRATA